MLSLRTYDFVVPSESDMSITCDNCDVIASVWWTDGNHAICNRCVGIRSKLVRQVRLLVGRMFNCR